MKLKLTTEDRLAILEDAVESDDIDLSQVEALLHVIAEENRDPSAAELRFIKKVTNWTDLEVRRNRGRVGRKVRLLQVAGSCEDRKLAIAKAEQDKQLLETEGVRIESEIERLTQTLDSIRRDAKLSAQRVTEHSEAVLSLRECLPPHIQSRVETATNAIKRGPRKELSDFEIRKNEIIQLLDEKQLGHVELVRDRYRHVVSMASEGHIKYSLSDKWPELRTQLQAELVELETLIADLAKEVDAKFAEVELLKDFNILETPCE